MTLSHCLLLASALFGIGVYGLLSRRHLVAILLSVELMANAGNLVFIAFGHFRGGATGQAFTVFALALTVAEVVVGLALVMLVHRRHGDTAVDLAKEMKG
jgi:NADH-quinone oxidoreductase subunit K